MDEPTRPLLLLTPDFLPARGGIQVLTYGLATHLRAFEPLVVTLGGARAEAFDRAGAVAVRRLRPGRSHRLAMARLNAVALAVALRTRPAVVLSGHTMVGPAALLAGRLLRVPVVQYAHGRELGRRRGLTRRVLGAADAVVAVSRHTADQAVAAGARPDRVHVVPPGVDVPQRPAGERDEDPTVITIARLRDDDKGHDVMLRAMRRVASRVPGVRWVVIGDGPLLEPLRAEASANGLRGRVVFTGAVSDAERDAWLGRAHVFAMPSRATARNAGGEGFGIVFLEAAAHGLPVVAGDVAGARDAVEDGVTGLLVDPTDPDAVADALEALLGDPARAGELGAAGRRRAAMLSWPAVTARLERLLLDLVEARGR